MTEAGGSPRQVHPRLTAAVAADLLPGNPWKARPALCGS